MVIIEFVACLRPARVCATVLLAAALVAPAANRAAAQDAPPDGWSFRGELTSVASLGNAEAITFGLGSTLENRRGPNLLKLEAGGLRTESTIVTRRAVGTPTDYDVRVTEDTDKTAEAYFARGRYDRSLNERFFVFGGLDWMRNTFMGIDSRLLTALGAGNTWLEREDAHFRTSYALTYTFQSDVVDNPAVSGEFAGLRAGWDYWRRATATTELESVLVSDLNLEETDDIRVDFTNSVTVAISNVLALKPSLQLLWRNMPSLTEVELFSSDGAPLGESVLTPLEKTDWLFRMALVVTL